MKKIFTLLIFAVLSTAVYAQNDSSDVVSHKFWDGTLAKQKITIGIRGGINFNSMGGDVNDLWFEDAKMTIAPGWHAGLLFDCPILNSLNFQTGLFVISKGFRTKDKTDDYEILGKVKGLYLQIPLVFSYRYHITKMMTWEVNFGPFIATGLGGKALTRYKLPEDKTYTQERIDFFGDNLDESLGIKYFDWGLIFGTGITMNRFYLGVEYDLGIENVRNDICWSTDTMFKTRCFNISLGFNFN